MYKVVGDYQLTERIGKGNFADVYLGTSQKTGNKYAVKVISKETFNDPRLVAGLDAEIKIMKEFSHKNIVQLYKYFSSEKNYYLVVEYCAGGDLNKYIRSAGRLSEATALNFLAQLTEGLAFLHERNFIHRDLKPANVLLSEKSDNAVLKLADFGFARHLSTASLAQTRCGTPLYMAPEILEARDYDNRADVWSLGCIFYEMLVGTSPFKGTNEADLLHNIRAQSLKVPGGIEVSKVSIGILVKLLERSSTKRASIEQLSIIMRKITTDLEVSKPRSGSETEEPQNGNLKQSGISSPTAGETVTSEQLSSKRENSGGSSSNHSNNNDSQQKQSAEERQSSTMAPLPPPTASMSPASRADFPRPSRSPSHHQVTSEYDLSNEKLRRSSIEEKLAASAHNSTEMTTSTQPTVLYPPPPTVKLPPHLQTMSKVDSPVTSNNNKPVRSNSMSSGKTNPLVPIPIDAASITHSGKKRSDSGDQTYDPNTNPTNMASSPYYPGFFMEEHQQQQLQQQPRRSNSFKDNNNSSTPTHHQQPQYGTPKAESYNPLTPGYPNLPQPPPPTPSSSYGAAGGDPNYLAGRSPFTPNQFYPGMYGLPPSTPSANNNNEEEDFVVVDSNNNSNPNIAVNHTTTAPPPPTTTNNNTSGTNSNNKTRPSSTPKGGIGYTIANNISHLPPPGSSPPNYSHHESTTTTMPFTSTVAEPVTSRPGSFAATIWDYTKQTFLASSSGTNPSQYMTHLSQNNHNNSSHLEGELQSNFFHDLLARCELCCDTINVITNLADQIVLHDQQLQSRSSQSSGSTTTGEKITIAPTKETPAPPANTPASTIGSTNTPKQRKSLPGDPSTTTITTRNATESEKKESTTGGRIIDLPNLQREDTVDVSSLNNKNVNESIDHYLSACSLYFHAMTILRNLLASFTTYSESSEHQQLFQATSVLTTIKNDLSVMFDQLLHRADSCQRMIDQLVQVSPQQSYYHKVMIPKPEILLVQEAMKLDQEAEMEELLGNLQRSVNLYTAAKKLINGVIMTYAEENAKTVRNQLKAFVDNMEAKLNSVQKKLKQLEPYLESTMGMSMRVDDSSNSRKSSGERNLGVGGGLSYGNEPANYELPFSQKY